MSQITETNEVQFVQNVEPSIPNMDKGAVTEIEGIQVPSKFIGQDGKVDIKGLVKSYTHLEKRTSGSTATENTPAQVADNTPESVAAKPEEAVTEQASGPQAFTVEEANTWGNEYATTGKLSDKAYEVLQSRGISKDIVDIYIEGIKAKTQLEMNESYKTIGGEAEYKKMINWASNNLPEQEKAAFNKSIQDKTNRDYNIKNLYARYKSGNPTYISGNNVTEDSYANKGEFFAEMKKPEYNTDPAFRAKVMAKLQRSNITV